MFIKFNQSNIIHRTPLENLQISGRSSEKNSKYSSTRIKKNIQITQSHAKVHKYMRCQFLHLTSKGPNELDPASLLKQFGIKSEISSNSIKKKSSCSFKKEIFM